MKFHREGNTTILLLFLFVAAANIPAYLFLKDSSIQTIIGVFSLLFVVIVLQFFRSPNRTIELAEKHLLSPCDGKVVVIEEVEETEYYNEKRIQVSIFMSPLNVHINWFPISGIAKYVKYHPGKYLVAWHPKSSTENERTSIVVENDSFSVLIRQIAGAMARRIVYYPREGSEVTQGSELGFIKFGSRVDLLLPLNTEITVKIGDKVTGNRSIIAKL